ncbi:hypothetical protein [Actinoplanes sp. URMC 104]|uniref:hypothetical protein n=1 Tax=Actinoplanes sp. URMC 104 TaxID=3423409 RepID=UPI003F1DA1F9
MITGTDCPLLQVRKAFTAVNKAGRGAVRGLELIEPADKRGDRSGWLRHCLTRRSAPSSVRSLVDHPSGCGRHLDRLARAD